MFDPVQVALKCHVGHIPFLLNFAEEIPREQPRVRICGLLSTRPWIPRTPFNPFNQGEPVLNANWDIFSNDLPSLWQGEEEETLAPMPAWLPRISYIAKKIAICPVYELIRPQSAVESKGKKFTSSPYVILVAKVNSPSGGLLKPKYLL